VIERNVSRGQYVSEGERLFVIADASVLWFRFDVYEQQLPWLRVGQKVAVSLPSIPGETFDAVISFIDPMLDPAARTIKVRADIGNPVVERNGIKQRLFKFGMFAEGLVRADVPKVLAVPRTAVLYPGKSAHVFIDQGGGAYERRAIKVGQQGDELCEVRAGLEEGDRVVVSGNVLLDAQAQFSQNHTTDEVENGAMDLTPAIIVKQPAAVIQPPSSKKTKSPDAIVIPPTARRMTGMSMPTGTHMRVTGAATNKPGVQVAVNARARMRAAAVAPAPDATAHRMLEFPMFVRMAELRNAELAEARAAKVSGTNRCATVHP